LYVYIYAKTGNVILIISKFYRTVLGQLDEWFYIKCNEIFVRKKRQNRDISAAVQPISAKFGSMMQNGSLERIGRPPSWIYKPVASLSASRVWIEAPKCDAPKASREVGNGGNDFTAF